MQSLESAFGKALHQPMPFTTGGQTITDRLTAAKHSLAGSQLGKTICKATTEELSAPKKKHYLLHCTNEPNVSIPSMANLLIERTQNPNWIVVYKALITIHNLMCYGNERFSQYLASCNTTFNLSNFMDKANLQTSAMAAGYDMSMHVRRYGKYISEKIHTYRLCAFDFCKVKRGRDDGLLRTMHADKLLKTMPILQNQIDALLEFQVSSSELNNGVINCSFILLFRDLIRLFACYNDGVINLLEKFFDMNRKQCREALDMYKAFLFRLDKVSDFLRVAETVGIDRGEIPDLTRAPASLLEALEAHLYHLEGGKGPPPTSSAQQMVNQQIYQQSETFNAFAQNTPAYGGTSGGIGAVDDMTKQKYLEEEKERIRQYEEQQRQKQQQLQQQQPNAQAASTNPFGGAPPSDAPADGSGAPNDLLSFLDVPKKNGETAVDPTNPFASALFDPSQSAGTGGVQQASAAGQASSANPFMQPSAAPMMPQQSSAAAAGNPFNATFPPTSSSAYGGLYSQSPMTSYGGGGPAQQQSFAQFPQAQHQPPGGIYSQTPFSSTDAGYSSPFNNGSGAPASIGAGGGNPSSGGGIDGQLSNLVGKMGISGNGSESTPFGQPPMNNMMYGGGGMMPNGAYGIGGASQQPPQQQWNAFGGYNNVGGGGYMQQQQPPPNFGQPGGAYGMMNNGSNAFMAQQQPPQQQR